MAFLPAVVVAHGGIWTHGHAIKDSYIVRLVAIPSAQLDAVVHDLTRTYRVKLSKKPGGQDSIFRYAIQGFSGTISEADANALSQDPRVEVVEQNAQTFPSTTVNLSEPGLWGLDRIDQSGPVLMVNGSYGGGTYTYTNTGAGVYIYVVDGGVMRNHTEFSDGRVLDGPSFSTDLHSATDPCGGFVDANDYRLGTHGTAVASVAAGRTIGVARGAYVVPVRIGNCDGSGTLEWVCWGVDWIVSPADPGGDIQKGNPYPKHPAVVNMSVYVDSANPPGPGYMNVPLGSLEDAVNDVVCGDVDSDPAHGKCFGNGITVVVSANNQGNNNCTTTPARMAYDNSANFASWYHVISVGGTDEYDRVWRCANWNECSVTEPGSNTGACVDLYAPAHNLKVAHNSTFSAYRAAANSGTSFSAPFVTGIVALMLQANPNLTPGQVHTQLIQNASPLSSNFDQDGVAANDLLAKVPPQ